MEQFKEVINEAAGKIIGREEKAQRDSWFEEECQIVLEDKKRAYNKMINRITDKMNKNIRIKEESI